MRALELKLSAGASKGYWLLSPGCSKHFARLNVLVITDVPDDVTDAQAVTMANNTVINTPAQPKAAPTVAFARLGHGKLVNLVIGRPAGTTKPEDEIKRPVSVSLNDAHKAKLARLGGSAWLRDMLDAAPDD